MVIVQISASPSSQLHSLPPAFPAGQFSGYYFTYQKYVLKSPSAIRKLTHHSFVFN